MTERVVASVFGGFLMHHTARLKREAGTGVRDPLDEKYPFYAAWPTHTAECWGWPGLVLYAPILNCILSGFAWYS